MASMKRVPIALVVLCASIFLGTSKAHAQKGEKTEEMLSACRPITQAKISGDAIAMPQDFASGQCWGAFSVIGFELTTINSETHQPIFFVCLPKGWTRPQLIAVFSKYAENHPATYSEDFMYTVMKAEQEAFPCPK
jgi:hypothetical protein